MNEAEIAKRVLKRVSPIISHEHDKFGGWLAAGSGAGLALLIGQSEQMLENIAALNFFLAATLILISLVLYARQRWLASRLVGIMATSVAVSEIRQETGPFDLDVELFINEMSARSIWPFNKIMVAAGNRPVEIETQITQMAQRQTSLVVLQIVFVFLAVVTLLCGIHMVESELTAETVPQRSAPIAK